MKPEDTNQEVPNYGDSPLEYFAGLREALSFAAEMFRDLLTSVAREIVEWYNTYYVVIDSDAPKRKHTGRLRSARELRDIRRQRGMCGDHSVGTTAHSGTELAG